jgi:hypothetical protein
MRPHTQKRCQAREYLKVLGYTMPLSLVHAMTGMLCCVPSDVEREHHSHSLKVANEQVARTADGEDGNFTGTGLDNLSSEAGLWQCNDCLSPHQKETVAPVVLCEGLQAWQLRNFGRHKTIWHLAWHLHGAADSFALNRETCMQR